MEFVTLYDTSKRIRLIISTSFSDIPLKFYRASNFFSFLFATSVASRQKTNVAMALFSFSSGCMDRVRRAQENFAGSCCACVQDMPTPLFLAVVIFLFLMAILFVAGLVMWVISGPKVGLTFEKSTLDLFLP